MRSQHSDLKLRQDVIDELDWEPSVNAAGIGVTVHEGVVTLTGYVPSYAEKRAAEKASLRVNGVHAVTEEIQVRLPGTHQRNDADIARAALDAIKWHVHLPEDMLKVRVEDGWVTLDGEVDWEYQRKNAYDAVRPLTGVVGILNLIKVKPRLSPIGIQEKIRRALERAADEDASHIKVEVKGSQVILSGTVRTWAERADAARAAWSAPGVTEVVNYLEIRPFTYA